MHIFISDTSCIFMLYWEQSKYEKHFKCSTTFRRRAHAL